MCLIDLTDPESPKSPNDAQIVFNLLPPNQCDWMYTLTQISPNLWLVNGIKYDIDEGKQTMEAHWVNIKGEWTYISRYPQHADEE